MKTLYDFKEAVLRDALTELIMDTSHTRDWWASEILRRMNQAEIDYDAYAYEIATANAN